MDRSGQVETGVGIRDARSARLVIGNGSWTRSAHGRPAPYCDTGMPLTSEVEAWKGGASAIRRDQRTRADTKRPSCPFGELDQEQILRLAFVGSCSSS